MISAQYLINKYLLENINLSRFGGWISPQGKFIDSRHVDHFDMLLDDPVISDILTPDQRAEIKQMEVTGIETSDPYWPVVSKGYIRVRSFGQGTIFAETRFHKKYLKLLANFILDKSNLNKHLMDSLEIIIHRKVTSDRHYEERYNLKEFLRRYG